LNHLIYEHNKLYIKLKEDNLKPKFHHLLHYATVFEMSGPFVHYSSMRFEASIDLLNNFATVICREKTLPNIAIAIKHQLQFSFRLKAHESILPQMKVGPGKICDIFSIDKYELIKDMLPTLKNKKCFNTNWVEYKGTQYQVGMVVIIQ